MRNWILYSIFLAFLLLPNISGMAQSAWDRQTNTREREQLFGSSGRGLPPAQTSTIVLDETIHDGKYLIMLTPQYLWVNQLRIEIDRKIAHRHWVSFAPHYIQNNQQFQTHWGFGLGATYKWFVDDESPVYIGAGLQFTRHTFENYGVDSILKAPDRPFDKEEKIMWLYKTNVAQFGVNLIVGRYIRFTNHIYADIYAGFGYRMSSTRSTDDIPHEFTTSIFTTPDVFILGPLRNQSLFEYNYANQGLVFVAGVRFGIML
jgi:hypothetical protein